MTRTRYLLIRFIGPWIVPVVLVGLYQLYAMHHHGFVFPPVPKIWDAFIHTWNPTGLRTEALPSLENLAIGYFVGLAAALLLGVVVAKAANIKVAFEPLISFMLALPSVALVPVLYSVFGFGSVTRQIIIGQAVFFQVFINVIDGFQTLDPVLLQSADVYHLKGWRRLTMVELPGAGPQIFAGARTGLSLGVLVMIVSELIGTTHGIGVVTLNAQNNFDYPTMWAGMVFIALVGIVLNYLFLLVEEPVLRRSGLSNRQIEMKGL